MKKFIDYLRSFALIIAATGSLISCSNDFHDWEKDEGGTPPSPPTLSSVTVKTQPTRKVYGLNSTEAADPTDLTGLELTLTYSDGNTQDKAYSPAEASLYSVANFDRTTTGHYSKTADITYGSETVTAGITGLGVFDFIRDIGGTLSGNNNLAILVNGASGETATITLYATANMGNPIINIGAADTHITLTGNGAQIINGFSTDKPLFSMGGSTSLTMGIAGDTTNPITITGHTNNNIQPYYSGGAVRVDGGSFTMNSGEISNNSSSYGGGVYVDGGSFTMWGGAIRGNKANQGVYNQGGGVYVVYGGSFTMYDGKIFDNTANNGGGVYVASGTFTTHSSINDSTKSSYIYTNEAPSGIQNQVFNGGGTVTGITPW
ncbi:hypothetical protein FACS189487_00020 [Campylobacterota bacterium]|nr:hypothetical protein FACS189487_00020 [Campylobacterota bacterium]